MATAHSQTLRISSLSSSSSLSLSSAFSISFRSSRRAARPLIVFVSASLDAKPTVLIAEKLGEAGLKLLKEFANVDCSYNLSPEELCTKISLCDALIIRSGTKITHEVFQSSASRLKVVKRAGIGIDNVDLDAATEHGCLVVNAPTTNTVATAEHGITLLTAMARNVAQADASVKAGEKAFRRFTVSFRRSKTIAALFGDSIDCFDSSSKSKPQPTLCDELILPAGYPCSEYMMRKYISFLYYSKSRDPSAQWFSFREEASRYTSRGSETAPASCHFASLQCCCRGGSSHIA